ncbi:RagB/SusD family nutrient uptake outer membrane protein [Rhodocytophaga aerolata]|uniref:RagB/SusD family nutrient uptake outer membrane protein n=1 Tax=Rhodocytophaga aerolata TaxID=455078 RepID=A0ABT8RFU2_9BACT|nr:RagB/SusD family nutrient uptake outer membrane protein [Rhodocytophaga aerolata]MDO1449665.1 RagB/SusD family nutrient uptake outer membrane protein [Rhodocytophaga aerolata]
MKKSSYTKYIYGVLLLCLYSCADLDVTPKTAISSGNFFSNVKELEIGLNGLYALNLWKVDRDYWTDDMHHRGGGGVDNDISRATLNSESALSGSYWRDLYDGIKRANTLLEEMPKAKANVEESVYNRIEGEARAIRAYFYGILLTKFGDVPLITKSVNVSDALNLARTPQVEVLQFVYNELDAAAQVLPNENQNRATKGFALGMKARIALYNNDFAIARDAAKAVIDLGIYQLDPNFRNLFLKAGAASKEMIYFVPQSFTFNVTLDNTATRDFLPRNAGGFGAQLPTWEAVHIFESSDGLPIDESPLYNPLSPFDNRDPRLKETIVEFGTDWLGYIYQPHPDSIRTLNTLSRTLVNNNDSRTVANFASFTGFLWKKGIDQTWADTRLADPNIIILRYADVLLMYAEALIELNENLEAAQNAINQVRARAYGTTVANTVAYPAVTELAQAELRTRLRRERRVELMLEGLRYQDLIRWRIAKKATDRKLLGLPNPTDQIRSQWPFNNMILPDIDPDGVVIFNSDALITNKYARLLQDYDFDESRMYFWPIPAADRLLNAGLTQNPGY